MMNNTSNDNELIYTTRGSEKRAMEHAYKVGAFESLLTHWIANGNVPGLERLSRSNREALKTFIEQQVSRIEVDAANYVKR